jgi:hypothetical protein
MLCEALCKTGERCTYKAKFDTFCGCHKECPVCYDNKRLNKLKCGHDICGKCHREWFSRNLTCPVCRAVVREAKPIDFTTIALMVQILDPLAALEGRPPDVTPAGFAALAHDLGVTF